MRQRLKNLIDAKAMRLGVVTHLHASGLAVNVTLHISMLPARVREVAAAIAQLQASNFVGLTYGQFDMLVALVARTRVEAADIIDNQIARFDGIQAIDVREPVSYTRHRYDLVHVVDFD